MTVVVSDKAAIPTGDAKSWPLGGSLAKGPISTSKSVELIGAELAASYAEVYRSQPWVYAVVNKIARGIGRLPLRVYALDEERGTSQPVTKASGHELAILMSRPYPRGNAQALTTATTGSLAVYGHALWWKYRPRAGAPPIEVWPIDWRYITIHAGDDQPIAGYEFRGPRARKFFLPDEVVHFSWWSPAGIRGTSPLEALRTTLQLEDAGRRYAVASFTNGVRPSGALTSERPVEGEARAELKAEIEAIHSTPDNAFRMMLLDGGLQWVPFAHSAQEAQTIEHRKLNQIEVCAAYDMPPTMLQILDKATFSNIDEQHLMLYVDTFGPWIGNVEATIGSQLIWGEPRFQFAEDGLETYLAYDLTELTRPDIGKLAQALSQLRAAGGYTANDVRAAVSKARIDHPAADAILLPLNMEPVGEEEPGTAPRTTDPATAALLVLADELQGRASADVAEIRQVADGLETRGDVRNALTLRAIASTLEATDVDELQLPEEALA